MKPNTRRSDYKKYTIVCHDAGATNLILHYIERFNKTDLNVYMEGPAKKIWANTYPKTKFVTSYQNAIKKSNVLISGTGWSSNLEHNARKFALNNKKYSIAILDHWVNYEERFFRKNQTILPDEIWVFDEYAFDKAKNIFPKTLIKLKTNLYLRNEVKLIEKSKVKKPNEALYILSPVRNNWGKTIKGEFQALDFFIKNLTKCQIPKSTKIRLRLHPSELSNKYDEWIKKNNNINIILDNYKCLTTSIGKANWVIGCETYGLILALKAKKTVISTIPPWGHKCRLPHNDIIQLRNL